MSDPTIIKKYGNRRLYDTGASRYVTLDELAQKIRGGTDVRVVDAKSGDDLTQTTLTQIIVEGRGAARLLPIPLLTQLIRLGDDALAEFFGRYLSTALDLYLQARRGADAIAAYNPFAAVPLAATDAMARMWGNPFGASRAASAPPPGWPGHGFSDGHGQAGQAAAPTPLPGESPGAERDASGERNAAAERDHAPAPSRDDVAELRRELEELKRVVRRGAERDDLPAPDDDKAARPRAKAKSKAKAKPKPKPRRKPRTGKRDKSP